MRERGATENDLLARLAADERIPLGLDDLEPMVSDQLSFTGLADEQASAVAERVSELLRRYPGAHGYAPHAIL
jgi:adenylosuccinate lyase